MLDGSVVAPVISDDERGMTAVIEFLTAFVLFLMIVTAFLSLAQLTLGSYNSTTDHLDKAALQGLSRLTDSSGWFTPVVDEVRDTANSTIDWHQVPPSELSVGDLLPGLLGPNGSIDSARLTALANVTESQLVRGLGLNLNLNIRLIVRIIDSDDSQRVDHILFNDGTLRTDARDSATASRIFSMADEVVQVTLEVHDGVKGFSSIEISEFMPRPADGGPEWIELHNGDGFAVEMSGWGIKRQTPGYGTAMHLFQEGVLPGGSRAILSGDADVQESGNATWIEDVSFSGLLGVGAIEGLGDSSGRLELTHADKQTAGDSQVMEIEWNQAWNLTSGYSLTWTGGEPMEMDSWLPTSQPSPGD